MKSAMEPYIRPMLRKLTVVQARSYVVNHARELLELILPGHAQKQREVEVPISPWPARYEAPRLTKLTPEQAKLKLLGHLSMGSEGAKDLLELLFPEGGVSGR